MDRAGERLKQAREQLKLTYRDVVRASHLIAVRRGSEEFAIALSRLADIENKGTVPTMYRLYTLCAIYRLDFDEVLNWYGVPRDQLASEALAVGLTQTHAIGFTAGGAGTVPLPREGDLDLNRTTFLSHLVRRWGKLPLALLNGLDLRQFRYGMIGTEDWSMFPLLPPGTLVAIDDSRRKIAAAGWNNEFERPIYFLQHHQGYACGWCSLNEGRLMLQPHPASHQQPRVWAYPSEVDVIGQVVGVAMPLESRRRRSPKSAATPAKSPGP